MRPTVVGQRDARRHLRRIDAENIAGRAMQPDVTEIARLVDAILIVEEEPDAVGRVELLGFDLFMGHECDVRVTVTKQRDELFPDRAGQLALVLLLEFRRVGKPANGVAKGPNRELDQYLSVGGVIIVTQDLLVLHPRFDAEAHKIAFGAVYTSGFNLGFEEYIAGVDIGQPYPPGMVRRRHDHPTSVVEIEAQTLGAFLGGDFGWRRVGALLCGRRGRSGLWSGRDNWRVYARLRTPYFCWRLSLEGVQVACPVRQGPVAVSNNGPIGRRHLGAEGFSNRGSRCRLDRRRRIFCTRAPKKAQTHLPPHATLGPNN